MAGEGALLLPPLFRHSDSQLTRIVPKTAMPSLEKLAPHHLEMLHASGISDDVIEQRGYFTSHKKAELRAFGFTSTQLATISAEAPALVVPVYGALGGNTPTFYQIRPDRPRHNNKGQAAKYEMPSGQRMVLDVPPAAREWIRDPQRALYITEGVKKGDSGASRGLCVVSLLGVWNFRGANEFGGRTALGDWEAVALNAERPIYIVFDSDVSRKPEVHKALIRLRSLLIGRGADQDQIRIVYLEPAADGSKVGLDDFLVATPKGAQFALQANSVAEPRRLLAEEIDERPDDPERAQYQYAPGGIWWHQPVSEGSKRVQLCNFQAQIRADLLLDDGTDDRTRALLIDACLDGEKVRTFQVPADQLGDMGWVMKHLGARAILTVGLSVKDRIRHAMQLLSPDIEERTCYTHLGWRKRGEEWIYLHAAGAISAEGSVDGIKAEPPDMERYRLPDPPEGDALREAVRTSLTFLDVADHAQTWPLLAAMYTAPLAGLLPADFVLWIAGETGGRKSTATALALSHFGVFDRGSLPANFDSTANSVEGLLFAAKDAPAVVDDYNPAPDRRTQERMDQVAHRLLRSVGDLRGRSRMSADASVRRAKQPRCLAVATGEMSPPGAESSAARAFEVEWLKGSVRLDRLSRAQKDAPAYAQAMAGYIQYLASPLEEGPHQGKCRLDHLRSAVPALVRREAEKMPLAHGRIQDAAAKLLVGTLGFLRFARHVGAIDEARETELAGEALAAFRRCAERTGEHQAERKPSALFLDYLRALIVKGQAFLADQKTDECPDSLEPGRWGYQPARGNELLPVARPNAAKIGWVSLERGELYLESTVAHEVITQYAQRAGAPQLGTKRSLGAALEREGLLVRHYEGRSEASVRAGGTKNWCWVLSLNVLGPEEEENLPDPDPTAPPPAPSEPPTTPVPPAPPTLPDPPTDSNARVVGAPAENARTLSDSGQGGGFSGGTGGTGGIDSMLTVPPTTAVLIGNGSHSGNPPLSRLQNCLQNDLILEAPSAVSGSASRTASTGNGVSEAVPAAENGHSTHGNEVENGARLHASSLRTPPPAPDGAHTLISEPSQLPALLEQLAPAARIALDLETTGLNPRADRTRLLTLTSPAGTWLVDCFQVDPRPLWPLLAEKTLVGHNLVFDLGFLWQLGFRPGRVWDTILASRLLSAGIRTKKGFHTLAETAERSLGVKLPKELQRSDWGGMLSGAQREYAARDTQVLCPLADALAEELAAAGLTPVAEIENRCLPGMVWIDSSGIPFNAEAWAELADETTAERDRRLEALNALAPHAPDQLELGLGWKWGNPEIALRALREAGLVLDNTRDETLAALDHPLAAALREYRSAAIRLSTFGHNWLPHVQNGRIYPNLQQMGSRAGRMSCDDPNVQNIPRNRRYRSCIAAPDGWVLLKADYPQIELRIAALIANEERMLEAYRDDADLHTLTAQRILGKADVSKDDRQLAKSLNFGLLYGMGAAGLQSYALATWGVAMTIQQAADYRRAFFRTYPGLTRWHNQVRREQASETRTRTGRRRLLPPGTLDTIRINSPVQGTGADGLKRSLALLWERRDRSGAPDARPVLACHDELVVECPVGQADAAAEWLKTAMEDGIRALIAPVPVEVEVQIGQTWAG